MGYGEVRRIATPKSNKQNKKLTPFEQELIEAIKKIKTFKEACEANIVSILYKQPELLYESILHLQDFSNNIWKVYWQIANDIVKIEGKNILDDITIGLYLEKHPKLREKYDEYGGYDTIDKACTYVKTENFDGYIKELQKWNAVLQLGKLKFPINDRISDYADMTIDEIYNELEALLNHTFVNVGSDVKSYSISDGIYQLIEDLDHGVAVGLPYNNLPILTKETGGQYLGSITLVGGLSNVGKSTFARTAVIPSIIKNNEKIVVMLNEDSVAKYQRELLVTVANTVFKYDLQKYIVRDGNFNPEVKELLIKCAKWIEEKTANHAITIIPFQKYTTDKAIKVIKKFSSMGVKYFLLDTFKMDAGKVTEHSWLQMQQSMVDINDVVKAENKNVHILITFQLSKGSAKIRHYTQDNIGLAKNIIDVASTCIMIRDVLEDEYENGKHELKVVRLEGKNGASRIPVKLKEPDRYQLLFIVKNREGSANQHQIVINHDMSRNIMTEVGITSVPVDW